MFETGILRPDRSAVELCLELGENESASAERAVAVSPTSLGDIVGRSLVVVRPGADGRNASRTAFDRANPGPHVSFGVSGVEPGAERPGRFALAHGRPPRSGLPRAGVLRADGGTRGRPGLPMVSRRTALSRAKSFRQKLLTLNPNLVLIAEIRYRDAHKSYLPEGHKWWLRDRSDGSSLAGTKAGFSASTSTTRSSAAKWRGRPKRRWTPGPSMA